MSEAVAELNAASLIKFQRLKDWMGEQVIGQHKLIDACLLALLSDGHLLVEGAPGLAKTRVIKLLGQGLDGRFHRIQFTPDLQPADITGTDIYRANTGEFEFQPGPLFHNIVLADEINRASARVQSALLEAMAEHQVTVGTKTYTLSDLFLVMATQNPLEQEGTYNLPEAQLDRFLMHVKVDYPQADAEAKILRLARKEAQSPRAHPLVESRAQLSQADVFEARQAVMQVHMSNPLEDYLLRLVLATRDKTNPVAMHLHYGASPRASIALDRLSRAHAWLKGRHFVTPEDIHAVVFEVLRHRLVLSYQALAQGMCADDVIAQLLALVTLP